MNPQSTYVVVAVMAVAAVVALLFVASRRGRVGRPLTPLAGFAFALVVAGVVFGGVRWLGYGLVGMGVVLAVVDAVRRQR